MLSDVMGTVLQQCLRRQARAESSFCVVVRGRVVPRCAVSRRCAEKLLRPRKSWSLSMPAAPRATVPALLRSLHQHWWRWPGQEARCAGGRHPGDLRLPMAPHSPTGGGGGCCTHSCSPNSRGAHIPPPTPCAPIPGGAQGCALILAVCR